MKKVKKININIIFVIIVVFIFLCLIIKLVYIGTGNIQVKGKTLASFASDRDTVKKTINARRGTIYSKGKEVLAKDVNSYTVIAYLEPSRTKDPNRPYHVVNKELTAEKLSPIINMKKSSILKLLNTKIKTCNEDESECTLKVPYQVELGPGGRGITELVKGQIEDLDLPGIDFISSTKRYYPNGEFLSYTLGYARRNDNGDYVGEMGLEEYLNDELTGENGYLEYQSDLYGYQITSTPAVEQKATAGNDVYLTIDTNIQMFAEQAREELEKYKPEWANVAVMNAKTGEILGISSSPSFNNNTLNIKNYYDPFSSNTYEPGSTMKIFSFMSSMEAGNYKGDATYKSGKLKVDDATIKDWNGYGWGTITYNEGFMGSSNVAASKLALKLGRSKLMDYYTDLGFGKKTGISLPNESSGIVNFRYNTEIAAASYGQGMTVTAIQMLQALTTLGNKGVMLKPYLVSKIVDSEGNIVKENKRTEVKQVFSEKTVKDMLDLMRGVVDGRARMSTGTGYYIKGYDLVGKTGTAQMASPKGGYLTGERNHIRSFAGVFPGNDPQVIVYIVTSKSTSSSVLKTATKHLVKNVGTYLNIYGKTSNQDEKVFKVNSYINKNVGVISNRIEESNMIPVIIGDNEKVIYQYPEANNELNLGSKVFLVTSTSDYKMLDITGWSRNDTETYAKIVGLTAIYDGTGYVKSFNIKPGEKISDDMILEVSLEPKFKEETKEKKKKE